MKWVNWLQALLFFKMFSYFIYNSWKTWSIFPPAVHKMYIRAPLSSLHRNSRAPVLFLLLIEVPGKEETSSMFVRIIHSAPALTVGSKPQITSLSAVHHCEGNSAVPSMHLTSVYSVAYITHLQHLLLHRVAADDANVTFSCEKHFEQTGLFMLFIVLVVFRGHTVTWAKVRFF